MNQWEQLFLGSVANLDPLLVELNKQLFSWLRVLQEKEMHSYRTRACLKIQKL